MKPFSFLFIASFVFMLVTACPSNNSGLDASGHEYSQFEWSDNVFSGTIYDNEFTLNSGLVRHANARGGISIILADYPISCSEDGTVDYFNQAGSGSRFISIVLRNTADKGIYSFDISEVDPVASATITTIIIDDSGLPSVENLIIPEGAVRIDESDENHVTGSVLINSSQQINLEGYFSLNYCQ